MEIQQQETIPAYEEVEREKGKLVVVQDVQDHLKMSREQILNLVERGYFDRHVYHVGVNIQQRQKGGKNAKRFFEAEWLYSINRDYFGKSLKEIAKELNENYRWLVDASGKGLLEEGRISGLLWNPEWFRENLQRIHEKSYSKKGKWRFHEFYDLLNDNQKKWIEDYLARRTSGRGIKVGKNIEWNKKIVKPEKNVPMYRRELAILFYKLICGRCGIENYHELERPGKYRVLTDEEWERFNPEVFAIIDFGPSDMDRMAIGYNDFVFARMAEKHIKPFLYFVLNHLKEKWIEKKQQSMVRELSGAEQIELSRMRDQYETFEMSLDLSLAKAPSLSHTTPETSMESVFLTHEQVLLGKNVIQKVPNQHDTLKRMVIYMTGNELGIRPDELAHVKIEHFVLDEETKLLKRFRFDPDVLCRDGSFGDMVEMDPSDPNYHNGWGRLDVEYSKGDYSPSDEILGNLLVPRLVTLINAYLTKLYKKHPQFKGQGYLVRPKDQLPERPYVARSLANSIAKLMKAHFTFLPKNVREAMKYYDVRHTVYNLIIKANVPGVDFQTKERAAQIHVRHDVEKKTGNTGRTNYTKEITMQEYYTVVKDVLDFPWDLGTEQNPGDFYRWYEEKGYIKPSLGTPKEKTEEILVPSPPLDEEEKNVIAELEQQLWEKEQLLDKLANGPSGAYKNVDTWTKKTTELDREIREIQKQLGLMRNRGKSA